jgi:inner membrane protein
MPSPVGHCLAGYIIYRVATKSVGISRWRSIAVYLFAANAPDFDFIPGLLLGDLSRFHHGPSHSIGFSILFGMLASLVFSRRLHAFVTGSSLYLSHVLLDYLVQDPSLPQGVPLLWPLDHEYHMAPFAFFRSFDYLPNSSELRLIMSGFLTIHNLLTLTTEILILSPLLILVSLRRRRCELSKLNS